MNIVTTKNKQAVWKQLKSEDPDMARLIESVCKAFKGEYRCIIVEKV